MISPSTAHVLLNKVQLVMSQVELDRKEKAVETLREMANYITGHIQPNDDLDHEEGSD